MPGPTFRRERPVLVQLFDITHFFLEAGMEGAVTEMLRHHEQETGRFSYVASPA